MSVTDGHDRRGASPPLKTRLHQAVLRFAERHDLRWLLYHPQVFWSWQRMGRENAPAAVEALLEVFPPVHWVADVGAGSGIYAAQAARRGLSVQACERQRLGRILGWLQGVHVRRFDLTGSPPSDLDAPVDLAYCLEVAEHVPPALGDALVGYLSQLSDTIVFSAATPGQGGIGHVNEQPREYWIERFSHVGMSYDDGVSRRLAAAFSHHGVSLPWLITNVSVFRRRMPGHGEGIPEMS